MRSRTKRLQFRLVHLLAAIVLAALLVQPATRAWHWLSEEFSQRATPVVSVPDGGTVLIGGIICRRSRVRRPAQFSQRSAARRFVRKLGRQLAPAPKPTAFATTDMSIVTPRIIIQEDEEEVGWLGSSAASPQSLTGGSTLVPRDPT